MSSRKNERTLTGFDLASKWGFSDGELLGVQIRGYAEEDDALYEGPDDHDVLADLVRTHLLPLLPGVEVYEIGTCHNPIRTDAVLTDAQKNISVVVGKADVDAAAARVKERKRAQEE